MESMGKHIDEWFGEARSAIAGTRLTDREVDELVARGLGSGEVAALQGAALWLERAIGERGLSIEVDPASGRAGASRLARRAGPLYRVSVWGRDTYEGPKLWYAHGEGADSLDDAALLIYRKGGSLCDRADDADPGWFHLDPGDWPGTTSARVTRADGSALLPAEADHLALRMGWLGRGRHVEPWSWTSPWVHMGLCDAVGRAGIEALVERGAGAGPPEGAGSFWSAWPHDRAFEGRHGELVRVGRARLTHRGLLDHVLCAPGHGWRALETPWDGAHHGAWVRAETHSLVVLGEPEERRAVNWRPRPWSPTESEDCELWVERHRGASALKAAVGRLLERLERDAGRVDPSSVGPWDAEAIRPSPVEYTDEGPTRGGGAHEPGEDTVPW